MCQLKDTCFAAFFCPGERTLAVAEELAFQQIFRKGSAVYCIKRLFCALAFIMYALSKKLLTYAAFAVNQNVGIEFCTLLSLLLAVNYCLAIAFYIVKSKFGILTFFVKFSSYFLFLLNYLRSLAEGQECLFFA